MVALYSLFLSFHRNFPKYSGRECNLQHHSIIILALIHYPHHHRKIMVIAMLALFDILCYSARLCHPLLLFQVRDLPFPAKPFEKGRWWHYHRERNSTVVKWNKHLPNQQPHKSLLLTLASMKIPLVASCSLTFCVQKWWWVCFMVGEYWGYTKQAVKWRKQRWWCRSDASYPE